MRRHARRRIAFGTVVGVLVIVIGVIGLIAGAVLSLMLNG